MQQKGMVWVIGASGGLGRATAQAFAQNGWSVIAGARSFAEGTSPLGEDVTVLPLDVTSEESCAAFAEKALSRENRVDVLVCAAAQLVLGSCENTTVDELDRLLNVNVLGTVRMVQRALPLMRRQKGGKIILFSSINGLLGIPFQSAYTASKHALEGYAECLAMETADLGIQVCLVEPGDHRGGSSHTRLHAKNETNTVYQKAYENTCAIIHHDEENGLFPDRLGRKIVRNAQRRHMRFRLRVAKPDQHLAVLLHTLLPASLNRKILCSYYRAHL